MIQEYKLIIHWALLYRRRFCRGRFCGSTFVIYVHSAHSAAQRLNAIDPWRISAVTYMELAQGCRDKAELGRLKQGLAVRRTAEVLPVTPAISQRAADLIDTLALSPRPAPG